MKDNTITGILRTRLLLDKKASRSWTLIFTLIIMGIVMIFSADVADKKAVLISKKKEELNELQSKFVRYRTKVQNKKLKRNLIKKINLTTGKTFDERTDKILKVKY